GTRLHDLIRSGPRGDSQSPKHCLRHGTLRCACGVWCRVGSVLFWPHPGFSPARVRVGERSMTPPMTRACQAKPAWHERLAWTLGISVLWLVVYLGCNLITSQRSDVRTVRFEWEKHIPLIPW